MQINVDPTPGRGRASVIGLTALVALLLIAVVFRPVGFVAMSIAFVVLLVMVWRGSRTRRAGRRPPVPAFYRTWYFTLLFAIASFGWILWFLTLVLSEDLLWAIVQSVIAALMSITAIRSWIRETSA